MAHTFEKDVVLLMQHPIVTTPINQLDFNQLGSAIGLIERLIEWDGDEDCARSDCMQMARLYFCLAQLMSAIGADEENALWNYQEAFKYLSEAGIDLSINRWLRCVNIKYGSGMEIEKPPHSSAQSATDCRIPPG